MPRPAQVKTTSRERRYFSQHRLGVPLPDLIAIQKSSYEQFFKEGLRELFDEVSPMKDFVGRDLELYFEEYYLDEPKFDEYMARDRNLSFEAALRVKARLVNQRTNEVKEQEIYLGDFPLMTPRGTFIINGIERVIVSQLIRSSGVFFTSQILRGRKQYGAKIIPNRGAWLEIETSGQDVLTVKIDRKRKVAITALLRAFGYSSDVELRELFADLDADGMKYIDATLSKDAAKNENDGLIEVYKRIRPGDLATADNAKSLIYSMFFNFDRYDFGRVGRYKINERFNIQVPDTKENRVLRKEDLVAIIKEIIRLNVTQEEADDIDHLGNRRVRAIGELVQNKLRVGLARMERIIKDRMSTANVDDITPNQLINARPVMAAVKEFFMSSQLSQFMDQVNPLAELEHKRRISAMGPGGLSRERAGFEVRDVHPTYYGKICPIATPEGPNIGLVGHLASYARINQYGFLETPYLKVLAKVPKQAAKDLVDEILRADAVDSKGKVIAKTGTKITAALAQQLSQAADDFILVKPRVTEEIDYLNAFREERVITTSATVTTDERGYFLVEQVEARVRGVPSTARVEDLDYMDVASNQIVSIATSMIPFLEHDDAVRALMGTNMQRQAVSLVRPEAPIVGTGVEMRAAQDSGQVVVTQAAGEVIEADASHVVVRGEAGKTMSYRLQNFVRSNAATSMNQRPLVRPGDRVGANQVIADGASTDRGELALGQNLLVAFMPWEGGNYEDAILLSSRVVEKDRYTSIHIEDYSVDVRDTKLGPEVVTGDIPNISKERLSDLDADGIVRIGASVKSGNILVGKITPKGETELSAEEKLLRAIFGEKAKDVKDSSLYLQHGEQGKVVDIKIFSRENGDKLPSGVIKTIQISVAQIRKIQVGDKMAGRHGNKGVVSRVVPVEDMPHLPDGTPMDILLNPLGVASRMNLGQILETHLGLAAKALGYLVASPALNGVPEEAIAAELEKAGYPSSGKLQLLDGRTGDAFGQPATVGQIYMLKLNHLVEDKIHQRSIGLYSLITQQPLGGKAQFGGQRFGEMEVWALEAYGAAHTLQEILTIKSDDVIGRAKAYEATIKGEAIQNISLPESFNVLMRELKGLALDIELLGSDGKPAMLQQNSERSDRAGSDSSERRASLDNSARRVEA